MGDYSNSKQVGRMMACPAGQAKLDKIRSIFEGKTVTKVRFSNQVNAIGVHLHMNKGPYVLMFMPELRLEAMIEDKELCEQEHELYLREHPVEKPTRRRKRCDNE